VPPLGTGSGSWTARTNGLELYRYLNYVFENLLTTNTVEALEATTLERPHHAPAPRLIRLLSAH